MRRNNVFGFPIYEQGNINCEYYCDNSRNRKFDECICPSVKVVLRENNLAAIISCSEDFKECEVYKSMSVDDEKFIEKYISKYLDGHWLLISYKHWTSIKEKKIKFNSDIYLDALFKFFGFHKIKDEHVDGILYSNYKIIYDK